jgi:hypothetical protein
LFGFGFLLFCVIRLIGLRAGSHECTDFCPELFPISPTTSSSSFLQLSRKFRRNEIENRVVYPPPLWKKKKKKPALPSLVSFYFSIDESVTLVTIFLYGVRKRCSQ